MRKNKIISNDVLAYRISEKYEIPFNEIFEYLKALTDCISDELVKGEKVVIRYWGTFEVVKRAPRKGHNPHTGEIYDIPACNDITFRSGNELKDNVQDAEVD